MLATFGTDLGSDADEAVRLVAGLLRRGESGEAFRERRVVLSWSVSEAGLVSPACIEERGTAVRIRRPGTALLVARVGDGPETLHEAVREAARRSGSSPFFKGLRRAGRAVADSPAVNDEEELSAGLAAALHGSVPDPRGLAITLSVSWVRSARAVITSRCFLPCGASERLEASGVVARADVRRPFSFQSSRPDAFALFSQGLAEAIRPAPRLLPKEGEADVVLAPSASAVFWHETVGHSLEADGTDASSTLSRVRGAAVAPAGWDVTDDPGRPDLPGSYVVDDEGTDGQPVPLLRDGRVGELLTDRRSAAGDSNGHGRAPDFRRPPRPRMSNLVVRAGDAPVDELLERCGTGFFVREVSAGSADPESGRFVLLVEQADVIRRGRLGPAVSRFALTGDILTALKSLDPARGDEAVPASGLALCAKGGDALPVGAASPAMLVRGLTVRSPRR